jgi:hypothetical protein
VIGPNQSPTTSHQSPRLQPGDTCELVLGCWSLKNANGTELELKEHWRGIFQHRNGERATVKFDKPAKSVDVLERHLRKPDPLLGGDRGGAPRSDASERVGSESTPAFHHE